MWSSRRPRSAAKTACRSAPCTPTRHCEHPPPSFLCLCLCLSVPACSPSGQFCCALSSRFPLLCPSQRQCPRGGAYPLRAARKKCLFLVQPVLFFPSSVVNNLLAPSLSSRRHRWWCTYRCMSGEKPATIFRLSLSFAGRSVLHGFNFHDGSDLCQDLFLRVICVVFVRPMSGGAVPLRNSTPPVAPYIFCSPSSLSRIVTSLKLFSAAVLPLLSYIQFQNNPSDTKC